MFSNHVSKVLEFFDLIQTQNNFFKEKVEDAQQTDKTDIESNNDQWSYESSQKKLKFIFDKT